MTELSRVDEAFINLAYLSAMKGRPFPLQESKSCSRVILKLVEAEYNFVKLQGLAIMKLAAELGQDPDTIGLKIPKEGFKAAREYINANFPEVHTNVFDITDKNAAVSALAEIFLKYA